MFKIPPAHVGSCGCRLQDNQYRGRDEWFKDGWWLKTGAKPRGLYNGVPHYCRCQVRPKSSKPVDNYVTPEMYRERTFRITTYSNGQFR